MIPRSPSLLVLLLLASGCLPYQSLRIPSGADTDTDTEVEEGGLEQSFTWTRPKVDVLWVVDNSCSMSEEQASLAANFPSMIDFFVGGGFDWHVGVVATDLDVSPQTAGHLLERGGYRYLDEDTPDPVALFGSMVVGLGSSSVEKGRAAAYHALEIEKNGFNAGFQRDGSQVAIVVLSDEEDQSGQQPIGLDGFIDWLRNLRDPVDVTFSSIVTPLANCTPGGFTPGTEYLAVTEAVGGVAWSICDPNYAEALDQVGDLLFTSGPLVLDEAPTPSTIQVFWVPDQGDPVLILPAFWRFQPASNTLRFVDYWPEDGDTFRVTYEPLPTGR